MKDMKMKDWYQTFAEDLWLKPDDVGAEEAAFIKTALRLRRGQLVLDAPCGAGRIAIHLAHAECKVTGIDLKKSFTDRAAARFQLENQSGRFLHMDLREMVFSSEFHLKLEGIGPNYGGIKNGDSWK
ncbi:MAG: methyltransferase domain-containing protein [Proteobacteria bacterium]|nr:methyltransferase domain-containing protein [Pseudomonadota bacterium]MBU4472299.1 methyltransferase domain-containing protein [Pseudomonadota bacterium]MCG2751995.1 class I SAM-dependent methyltransferase [Desulfobacteraceae bacterium]